MFYFGERIDGTNVVATSPDTSAPDAVCDRVAVGLGHTIMGNEAQPVAIRRFHVMNTSIMSRRHVVAYWVTTVLVVFELVLGGVWDVLRVPQVRGLIERLGYPSYFLVILGIWKLLGAVALVVPRFPRLKEWAYAGVFFDLTGAIASQWASGLVDTGEMAYPIIMTGLAVASWALRPPSRRLGTD